MGRAHAHDRAPVMVVCDGGTGFEKARKIHWPQTRVQRCTFHAFTLVKRYTTSRPRTQAGGELYGLAKDLLKVADHDEATAWTARFVQWSTSWQAFLAEQTITSDGQRRPTRAQLVKACNWLARLVKTGVLFT